MKGREYDYEAENIGQNRKMEKHWLPPDLVARHGMNSRGVFVQNEGGFYSRVVSKSRLKRISGATVKTFCIYPIRVLFLPSNLSYWVKNIHCCYHSGLFSLTSSLLAHISGNNSGLLQENAVG